MRFKFIILSFLLIGVFACEKDKNDDYAKLIIGKWEARTLTSVVTNEKGERIPDLEGSGNYDHFEIRPFIHFKSDGTGFDQDYDVDGTDAGAIIFKWSIKADVLTLEFQQEDDEEKGEDTMLEISKMNITIVNDVLTTVNHINYDYEKQKEVVTAVWHRAK